MSVTVFYFSWLSVTVCTSAMEFQHISHSLLWLVAVSNYLYGPMELLQVYHCLFQFHGVSACLSQSPLFAGFLSRCHRVACMSLTASICGWQSRTVSPRTK